MPSVLGLVNLIDHRYTHGQLLADAGTGGGSLLREVLKLMRSCESEPSMRLVVPNVISAIETLCRNEAMAADLLKEGFVVELLAVASDVSAGEGLVALSMRRSAVQALCALSQINGAKLELKKRGALELAVDLLDSNGSGAHAELARAGSVLSCNLCLHPENKRDIAVHPLLQALISAMQSSPTRWHKTRRISSDDTELSLALAALATDPALLPRLAHPETTKAIHAVLRSRGASHEACRHAMWAASSLATHRPVEPSLLDSAFLATLVSFANHEDRRTRQDAMRTVGFLCMEAPKLLPRGSSDRMSLLSVVVRCGMSTDTVLQELSLLVLGLWAEDLTLHSELVYGGALAPLVLALNAPWTPAGQPAPKGHLYGARALSCIAIHSTYRNLICDAGALPPLLKLINSTDATVRLSACRAICSISNDAEGSLAILRDGGLGTILTAESGNHTQGAPGSGARTPVKSMKTSGRPLLAATLRSPTSPSTADVGGNRTDDDDDDDERDDLHVRESENTKGEEDDAFLRRGGCTFPSQPAAGRPSGVGEGGTDAVEGEGKFRLAREALEREYASKAAANCYAAWKLEDETFQAEEERFEHLEQALSASSVGALSAITEALEVSPASPFTPTLGPGRTAGDVPDSPRSLEARLGSVAKTRPPPDMRAVGVATPAGPGSLPRAPLRAPLQGTDRVNGTHAASRRAAAAPVVSTGVKRLERLTAARGSTSFRVTRPDTVLLSAAFVGWKYLCAIRAHENELRQQDGAAKVLQGANRKHQKKRQTKSATKIQAGFRGKKVRAAQRADERATAMGSVAMTSVMGSAIRDEEIGMVNAVAGIEAGGAAEVEGGGSAERTAQQAAISRSEMDEAAEKIQAVFKGRKVRKKTAAEKAMEREAMERVQKRASLVESTDRRSRGIR